VQRLFSIFPGGWPGGGLLILRLVTGGILVMHGATEFVPAAGWSSTATAAVQIVSGLFLLLGLWTPVGCLFAVAAECRLWMTGATPLEPAIQLLAVCVAVAMLGPGSWSIDAALFGRHRLDIKS
jgi:putative oxidoreductase